MHRLRSLAVPSLLLMSCAHGGHHAHSHGIPDVPGYIARLESPDRDGWQRPDAVLAQLALKGSEVVADVGAGGGYFSFRFARALPSGQVVALEVEPQMVDHVRARAAKEGVANLRPTLARPEDPGTPVDADLVFLCNVLHHVAPSFREQWFAKLAGNLKPGARLVLLEFKEGQLPVGPPDEEKLPRSSLLEIAQRYGLTLAGDFPEVVPYQHFLVFTKP